ncbi:hypothetical protein NQZ79_g3135 [Umbelopsis isabellina]|nr:hypothetical protein NQZ79_g3135 [Umbelopsis isabellina]
MGIEQQEGLEFQDCSEVSWDASSSDISDSTARSARLRTKTLAIDETTGDSTFILEFLPSYLSGTNQVTHEYWEQVYILEGELEDLSLKKIFRSGDFAFRPPGMKHGPYAVSEKMSCKMLVIITHK